MGRKIRETNQVGKCKADEERDEGVRGGSRGKRCKVQKTYRVFGPKTRLRAKGKGQNMRRDKSK